MRKPRVHLALAAALVTAAASAASLTGAGRVLASDRSATAVQVSLTGKARVVTPTLLGLNAVNVTGPPWNDPSFDTVLHSFGPGVFRYPGGTNANYWAWRVGWFQPGHWPAEPSTPVDDTIPVFYTGMQAAGAVPMYDLNTLTYKGAIGSNSLNSDMLGSQIRFLRAAAAASMPVTMVELGNELYLNGPVNYGTFAKNYVDRFPTAGDYATQMNVWIAAIHKDFSGVKIAAVADDPNYIPGVSKRRLTWNNKVLAKLVGENAVTVHENERVYNASATPGSILAQAYIEFQTLRADQFPLFESYHLPVWITAFNMTDMTSGHVFEGTWLHGLYVAEQALLYAVDPEITYAGLNDTVGTAKSAAIFDGPDGFGTSGPATTPLALTAAGTTMSAIQSVFHGATYARPLAFSPSPVLHGTTAPALQGDSLVTPSGRKAVLVNLASHAFTVSLSTLFPHGFTATQIAAPTIMTQVTGPGSVSTTTTTGAGDIRIPPYTLVTVSHG